MVQETDTEARVRPEDASLAKEIRDWQSQLVRGVLRALVVVGLLAAAVSSYYALEQGLAGLIAVYWLAYALVLVIAFWRRVPYAVQVWVIIAAFYVLALIDFATEGRGASGRLFLLLIPFAAALFLGRREAVLSLVPVFLTMLGFAWAFSTGLITDYQEVSSTDPAGWASNTFIVLMLSTLIVVSLNFLVPRLASALRQSRRLAEELEEERSQLERTVAERTADLRRRSTQLETAAQVARDVATLQDLDRLLAEVVDLISERFGFYHTGIFLLDEAGEYAVLQAASSRGGRQMLRHGHRLRVGQVGIVGYVVSAGEPRIALDVGEDAVYFDNPDLPETRSEIALPLWVQDEVIGALDVQSTVPEAFDEEDLVVLQTLADQVAAAINNARLVRQVQDSLEAERRAYGELSAAAWQVLSRTRAEMARRYDPQGILPGDGGWCEEMRQAVREVRPVLGEEERATALAIPLKVRGQVIGVLDAHRSAGSWRPEDVALLETMVEQLGQALDSARLYEEAQRREARERLIGQVTARMRESLDVDTILKASVREMREALGIAEVQVHLGTPET